MSVTTTSLATKLIRAGFPRRGASATAAAILEAAPQGGGGGGGVSGYTDLYSTDLTPVASGGNSRLSIPTWIINRDRVAGKQGPEIHQSDEFFDVVGAGWYAVRMGGYISWTDDPAPTHISVAFGSESSNHAGALNFPVNLPNEVVGQSRAHVRWEIVQPFFYSSGWVNGDSHTLGPWIQWVGSARALFTKSVWAEVAKIG